jgi:hypothetical protein
MKRIKMILFSQNLTFFLRKKEQKIALLKKNKKEVREIYSHVLSNIYNTTFPIHHIQIRITSPSQIRTLCLRKSSEGFLFGRIWNSITVNYKDLKPIPGGLFCQRAFGSLHRGICSCNRTRWRSHPIFPKKLRRLEVLDCPFCDTKTIYSHNSFLRKNTFYYQKDLHFWKNLQFPIKKKILKKIRKSIIFSDFLQTVTLNRRKKEKEYRERVRCKCGKSNLHIHFFFSVSRFCKFCITSTSPPFYGKISTYFIYKINTCYLKLKKRKSLLFLK